MKVHFKWGIATYSGTRDEMTFESYREHHICIGRKWFIPTPNLQTAKIPAVAKNLRVVWKTANQAYKDDYTTYATRNKKQNYRLDEFPPTAFVLFVHAMYAWFDTDPTHIDLTAITVADIVTRDADVRTVTRSIEAGFLFLVHPDADLTSDIQ